MSHINFAKPTVKLSSDEKTAELKVLVEFPDATTPAEFPAILTFVDKGRFIELREIIRPTVISNCEHALLENRQHYNDYLSYRFSWRRDT